MKDLICVSRWITVQGKCVTPKHSLWYYAEKNGVEDDGKAYLDYFRYKNREYAIGQFLSRFGMMGFDMECEKYPRFICAYDGDGDLYNPLLMEMDEYGEKIRLWMVA